MGRKCPGCGRPDIWPWLTCGRWQCKSPAITDIQITAIDRRRKRSEKQSTSSK